MLKKTVLITVIMVFMLSLTQGVFAGTNLIQNPSFEQGSGLAPDSWDTWCFNTEPGVTEYKYEKDGGRTGERYITIINNSKNDARYKQTIAVKEGSIYKLSCWTKTEGVGDQATGANISIEGRAETSRDIKGTNNEWQYMEMYAKIGKGIDTISVTVDLGSYGNENTGKASFDDVSVEEISAAPAGAQVFQIDPPGTDNTSDASNKTLWIIIIAAAVVGAAGLFFVLLRRRPKEDNGNIEIEADETYVNEVQADEDVADSQDATEVPGDEEGNEDQY